MILFLVLILFIQPLADGTLAVVVGDDAGLLAPGTFFNGPPYWMGAATVGFCAPAIRSNKPQGNRMDCVSADVSTLQLFDCVSIRRAISGVQRRRAEGAAGALRERHLCERDQLLAHVVRGI